VVVDNCGNPLTPTGPVQSAIPACEGDITYTWTYTDCEGNFQDYVHTVTIEYEPFPAITPTFATVDCIANIVMPTLPTVVDNCGNPLTPTGPVQSAVPACEGDITWTWTYTDCEGNFQDYVHTVTIEYEPFPAITPTFATVDCIANIVMPDPASGGGQLRQPAHPHRACSERHTRLRRGHHLHLDLHRLRRELPGLCPHRHHRVRTVPGNHPDLCHCRLHRQYRDADPASGGG
jgi:hypothetical protein